MADSMNATITNEKEFFQDDDDEVLEIDEDFPDDSEEGDENSITSASPWRDLSINTWFRVEKRRKLTTRNGEATIIHLQNKQMKSYCVWTTKIIAERLDNYPESYFNIWSNDKLYIKSKGLTQAKNGNEYYDFALLTKKSIPKKKNLKGI